MEQAIAAALAAWDEVVLPMHLKDPEHYGPRPPREWFEHLLKLIKGEKNESKNRIK